MDSKSAFHEFKCFGSATVGARGQVVIPASARKELGIDAGATLLVFRGAGGALALFKADAIEQILKTVSEQLSSVEKMIKTGKALPEVSGGINEED